MHARETNFVLISINIYIGNSRKKSNYCLVPSYRGE